MSEITDLAVVAKLTKLRKKLSESLIEELDVMSVDDLRSRIVRTEMNCMETERARDADTDLESARDTLKEMGAPYKEAIKAQRTIGAYAALLLEAKGRDE